MNVSTNFSGMNVSSLVLVTRLLPILNELDASIQIAVSTACKDSWQLQRSCAL